METRDSASRYEHSQQQAERERPALNERRQAITAEITRAEHSTARYFDAFQEGRLSPSAASNASPTSPPDSKTSAHNKPSYTTTTTKSRTPRQRPIWQQLPIS